MNETKTDQPHTLTDIKIACGVTLEQITTLHPKVLIIDHGDAVVLPANTPPALATSTARYALGGPAEFSGLNQLAQLVYRRRHDGDGE